MKSETAGSATVIRAVFFGSGSFAVPILDSLISIPRIHVEAVVSAPDRPVGRRAVVTPTPVTSRARELGLTVLQPARVRSPQAVAQIAALAPDVVLLADYGQLIPRVLLDLPPRGFLNLHPSELPRWRGAAPIPATILAGDHVSAVTLMVVSEAMDEGPIVATARLAVVPDDTSVTLEERAASVAGELLRRALPEWLAGELVARPQPSEGVTLTRPLRREDGLLNVCGDAEALARQVRAYQPWPGSYVETSVGRLVVWRAEAETGGPGEDGLLIAHGDGLAMTTPVGLLVLHEVQLAGKRRVTGAELRRGYPGLLDKHVG